MVRLSQGEIADEEPPFEVVDGRDARARGIDAEVEAWHRAHGTYDVKKPSELKREDGLQLMRRFGVMVCTRRPRVRSRSRRFPARSCGRPCGHLIIVRNGEKLPRCGGCGGRVWVKYGDVIFQHDDLRIIRRIIAGVKGCIGSGKPFPPAFMLTRWKNRACQQAEIGRRGTRGLRPSVPATPDVPVGGSSAPVTNY